MTRHRRRNDNGLTISLLAFLMLYLSFSPTSTITGTKDGEKSSKWENTKVRRTVDLTSQLVKIREDITLKRGPKEVNEDYIYQVWNEHSSKLSFIEAHILNKEDKKLKVKQISQGKFTIAGDLLEGGGFTVKTIYSRLQTPFPKEIKQGEKQFVKYKGLAKFYSPYKTTEEETKILIAKQLPSETINIVSYSPQLTGIKKNDKGIICGPFKDTLPNTELPIEVHFENNMPFLAVTMLKRVIEVSLWGNMAVEETIDVTHIGAKLIGAFSRFDLQRAPKGLPHVEGFVSYLPAAARDVYYRDVIGNVSTSHLREHVDSVEMEIRPRFPLLGGWKTQYTIGYNIPAYEVLYRKGNKYALKSRFLDHLFDDQVIDELLLEVILPEKSHSVKWTLPYEAETLALRHIHTYLDAGGDGRLVYGFTKKNLVEAHIADFTLHFAFSPLNLVREPLLVVSVAFVLFVTVIVCVRLDFSLSQDDATESVLKIGSIVSDIQNTLDKRSALYQAYEDALKKFKADKDASKFGAQRKVLDGKHKVLNGQIGALQGKLKELGRGAEALEKVNELQKLDGQYREQLGLSVSLAEKLVGGKMSKTAYVEAEDKVGAKKGEIVAKCDAIINTL